LAKPVLREPVMVDADMYNVQRLSLSLQALEVGANVPWSVGASSITDRCKPSEAIQPRLSPSHLLQSFFKTYGYK
jgi:hypothetical protein